MAYIFELLKAKPIKSSLSVDGEFHRKYTSVYQVVTERDVDPFIAGTATDLPLYGDSYRWEGFVDLWAFAKSYEIEAQEEIQDPKGSGTIYWLWQITITHDSKPTGGSNNLATPRENPLDDPPVISGSFASFSSPRWKDREEEAIVNAAKMPYTPPVEVDDAFDTLRISYNTATISLAQRAFMINKVNSTAIWGLERRRAKLKQWNYQVLRAGPGFDYIKHDFSFEISWVQHPTDAGLVSKGPVGVVGYYHTLPNSGEWYYEGGFTEGGDGSPDSLEALVNAENLTKFAIKDEPAHNPGKLDDDGDKLPEGEPLKYMVYEVEEEADFNAIPNIPNPLPGPFS